eukprot:5708811-Pyramimonas_sp.AAC.1
MEEFESYDASQVVAALANVSAQTLLMAGDQHHRVENFGGRRARSTVSPDSPEGVLPFAPHGLE